MNNDTPMLENGPAAAAILSAAVGCFTIGLLQFVADLVPRVNHALVFYRGSGALSGETTLAIALWLLLWFLLNRVWKHRSVRLQVVNAVAFTLLGVGVVLTFPPLADVFKR